VSEATRTVYEGCCDEAHEVVESLGRSGQTRVWRFALTPWGWQSEEFVCDAWAKKGPVTTYDSDGGIRSAYRTKRTPWHEMRDERDAALAQIEEHKRAVQRLRVYLNSSKFRNGDRLDGYVNVVDVLSALEGI
jgi:hypothetical protein